jgi:type III secretory pathway component EscR
MSKLVTILFVSVVFFLMNTFAGYVPVEGKIVLYGLAILASMNIMVKA